MSESDVKEPVATADGESRRPKLLGVEQLARTAQRLAASQTWTDVPDRRSAPLVKALGAAHESLAHDNTVLTGAVHARHPLPSAAEWLLDNYYLVLMQIRVARADLPARYESELPRLTTGELAGYPRVYEACVALVGHTDGQLDDELLTAFLTGYQDSVPLTIGELWAVPIVLRIALIDRLRQLSAEVVTSYRLSQDAERHADTLLETFDPSSPHARDLLSTLESDATDAPAAYLARLAQRLRASGAVGEPALAVLARLSHRAAADIESVAHSVHQQQAAVQISIANAISSLRFLEALDWKCSFEALSVVERTLARDPAGVYPLMDFESRDRCRHALEELARRTPLTEQEVAEAVVKSAERHPPGVARHVGYHVLGEGRPALEESISYAPRFREWLHRGPLRHRGAFYWGTLCVATTTILGSLSVYAAAAGAQPNVLVILVAMWLIPASEVALVLVHRLSVRLFPPRPLPRLDFRKPVSQHHRTLVVIPSLLSSVRTVRAVIDNLEIAYVANRDPNIGFALLGDLATSPEREVSGDAIVIEAAEEGIARLNERYATEHGSPPFFLFVRGRTYCAADGTWRGWERKRGALVELNRMLRGAGGGFIRTVGEHSFLPDVTFVITIDSDTLLPRDSARRLIATIAHPMNRADHAPGEPIVARGYGLVQPRVSMMLPGSTRSLFAWMHSGEAGVNPYAHLVSDPYQDVFGEGSFTGKGIYEVDVFNTVLEGRFPEGALLSHDLLEGCYLRVGFASDVEVLDDHPTSYRVHAARLHRWIRGDWQTLPWLGRMVPTEQGRERNPLSRLHRWKIFDNVRRALLAPTLVLSMTLGWALVPVNVWVWPALSALVVFFPLHFALVDAIREQPGGSPLTTRAAMVGRVLARETARSLFALATLPHQTLLAMDACVRALWRMSVTRRRLLEWETAADAARRIDDTLASFVRTLALPSVAAGLVMLALAVPNPARLPIALLLCALFASAPYVAWRASLERTAPEAPAIDPASQKHLRQTARSTWRFFETFVTGEGHHLAPDNYQEDPKGEIAFRTSPTNLGLQLLSAVSAHDLGYLTLPRLVERTSDTLGTMAGLRRFRGHFYNWYEIRTLEPLPPHYVSTVDSGNLAGHLLVLRTGLLELSESSLIGAQTISGFVDTIEMVIGDARSVPSSLVDGEAVDSFTAALETMRDDAAGSDQPSTLGEWATLIARWSRSVDTARLELARVVGDNATHSHVAPHPALDRLGSGFSLLVTFVTDLDSCIGTYAPWAHRLDDAPPSVRATHGAAALSPLLSHVPSLVGLAEGLGEALAALDALTSDPPSPPHDVEGSVAEWAAAVASGIRRARPSCQQLLGRLRLDAEITREMWEHTDFSMLFDEQRFLFSIGYSTIDDRLDASYYDLLASECRLASFIAIAKDDVPQEHWFRLGRQIASLGGHRALLSWSASMFEYLMPLLIMRSWPMTLLDETYRSVVACQMAYGRSLNVPWGISESAFNVKDAELTYQYQAFGVPGLGLKRGLSEDIVVAPYACMLALPLVPLEVVTNLRRIDELGGRGCFGYYESIDFTPGRVPPGARHAVVKAYMAHHQGMSLVAIGNALAGNRMRQRFHAAPAVAATELLLQERVPHAVELTRLHAEEAEHAQAAREIHHLAHRTYPTAETPTPATHFLSNGRYSVMVTSGGGGYARWNGRAITRYREDVTRDMWGCFFYIRDIERDVWWSAARNPAPRPPDKYRVMFTANKAEYSRVDGSVETTTEVAVSPEDDVEVRRVTVANRGTSACSLDVTSYFEVALTDQAADQAHRAFSNLFVETEAIPEVGAILFSRRPRSSDEQRVWGFHLLACESSTECAPSLETDRARFLGRHRSVDNPVALDVAAHLSGTTGAVLDPICSLRQHVTLEPGESSRLVYVTGVCTDRQTALGMIERYREARAAQRAIDLAWATSLIETRDLGIGADETIALQRLASRLLLTDPYSPLKITTPTENRLPISALWALGISGDLPILLVRVEDAEHTPLVRQALLAHQYWRHKGLVIDLVILNTRPSAYSDELDDRLRLLVRTGHALQLIDKPGGVFIRRADRIHPDTINLLHSVARVVLDGSGGLIDAHLGKRALRQPDPPPFVRTRTPVRRERTPFMRPALTHDNGYGGFDSATGEYVVVLSDVAPAPPAPWINVIASQHFGCMVSEAGIACSWAENSHENRLTTWNNDPVSDGTGEVLYVRDEETGEYWCPTPLPIRGDAPYVMRHGFGYSRLEHRSHGIGHDIVWFVPKDDPVRALKIQLTNHDDRPRLLSLTHFVEWVLGSSRSRSQQQVVTWFDSQHEMLTAHNYFNEDFPGRPAFLACTRPIHSWTASRTEFLGRNGRLSAPAALGRERLGGVSGRFHDNCGAIMARMSVEPGATMEVTFLLGQARTLEEARAIAERYRKPDAVGAALGAARKRWVDDLGVVEVSTPSPELDTLVNGRLLYQALACRLWGRTATYQSSGAFGFRDQLQDVLCLLYTRPDLVRAQIVEASRRQFPEGDVLHWWQPISGRGVRTRITDDRHWLPYVTAEYVRTTGDTSLLDERTPFLEAQQVEPGREDAYVQPAISEHTASVYEHCVAALETAFALGPNGLPLIGGGDWNDGMNRVGHAGRGESVWLSWFLDVVLRAFAPLCELKGEPGRALRYRRHARALVSATEEAGWDGEWYRRAFFDDGTPLGTKDADECRIDAIAQAWAAISGQGDPERTRQALEAVEDMLVNREAGLVALLSPPFDRMEHDPGYIKGYVPGVRENGGQYTHAALWVALARLLRGDGDEAFSLLDLLNPINHARTREGATRYRVEPYVVAADVYTVEPHVGRGGWTWYTGSASWFYRVLVEHLLGLKLGADSAGRFFTVDPCIPREWPGFAVTYRDSDVVYRVSVENPHGVNRGVAQVAVEGEVIPHGRIARDRRPPGQIAVRVTMADEDSATGN